MKILLQYLLPHHFLSRFIGAIAKCRWRWLKTLMIKWFIKKYQIDMTVVAEKDLDKYQNFNEFFTRKLAPKARPIARAKKTIVSPVDGHFSQIGNINKDTIIQAKGHNFNLASLIGTEHADKFVNGEFATIYLSPQDYHCIHMPLAGKLTDMIHIPGRLFSVQPDIISSVPNLYARNERVVNIFQTEVGPIAVILVGAMLVASIKTVWAGEVTPPTRNMVSCWNYEQQEIALAKGEELGCFQFGSTVILLFPEKTIAWEKGIYPEQSVLMGRKIGQII